jgi:type IV secretion system protein VirB9
MKAKTIVAVLLSVACQLALAARDPRIRVEQYDPDQVVNIYTQIGNPTLIQFEDDERIVNDPKGMVGMGDAKAWTVGPRGSNIMLKPRAKQPDTKLLIVTNKRTYAFEIRTATEKSKIPPTLIVRFTYPDTIAKLAKADAAKQGAISDRLQEIAVASGRVESEQQRNRNYMKRGDEALAPSQVEDDGRFTYMRFNSSRELPNVYKIGMDGKEALANFHVDPDTRTLIVHDTAAMFVLRYGQAVMAIRNDGYNPNGALNPSGSTVPRTLRLLKESQ